MASPMVDGRVEPHRKATYTLEISDQVRKEGKPGSGLSGVKYNHKPSLASGTRTTSLRLADNNTYNLSVRDKHHAGKTDMFVFNGSRTAPPKSYVLLFDQTTQKATLERLDSTYTFNLATKNGTDVSSEHGKIYPKKAHKDSVHDKEEGEVDLFAPDADEEANAGTSPDASNPYDFRHFLNRAQGRKDKDSSEAGYASSPDARNSHSASAAAAPTSSTHTSASQPARRAVDPAPKKRKAASVFAPKPAAKGGAAKQASAAPTIHLERKATERASTGKSTASTTATAPASKIKSAEFVQSSDDSDIDAEGDADSSAPTPRHSQQHTQNTQPSRSRRSSSSHHSDDSGEEEEEASHYGDLEIEIPDAKPRHRNTHLHANTYTNDRTRSPSAGPISLASAANSVENTPRRDRRRNAPEEIDFGTFDDNDDDEGGYREDDAEDEDAEDEDFEQMEIGPPAGERKSVGGNGGSGNAAAAAPAAEVDEDDPLYMEMMEGLQDGESSEESEEE